MGRGAVGSGLGERRAQKMFCECLTAQWHKIRIMTHSQMMGLGVQAVMRVS